MHSSPFRTPERFQMSALRDHSLERYNPRATRPAKRSTCTCTSRTMLRRQCFFKVVLDKAKINSVSVERVLYHQNVSSRFNSQQCSGQSTHACALTRTTTWFCLIKHSIISGFGSGRRPSAMELRNPIQVKLCKLLYYIELSQLISSETQSLTTRWTS